MKKWIIPIVLFCLISPNVIHAANDSCKLDDTYKLKMEKSTTVNFSVGNRNKTGYFYLMWGESQANGTVPFLCIDLGKKAGSQYVVSSNAIPLAERLAYAKAYAFMSNRGNLDKELQARVVAQIYTWYVSDGNYYPSSDNLYVSSLEAFCQMQVAGGTASTCKKGGALYNQLETDPATGQNGLPAGNYIRQYINELLAYNAAEYVDQLTIYQSKTSAGSYQRMLAAKPCMDVTYACPNGTKKTEVTSCVQTQMAQGKTEAQAKLACEKQYCTETGCKPGYEIKVVGNGPTCSNDNKNHHSTITEKAVFKCNAPDSIYGRESGSAGSYCKLYCLETTVMSFPGGISTAIPLGTSLVWPTSDSNSKSIWGNRFSLSYAGKRNCKIRVLRSETDDSVIPVYNDYTQAQTQMANNRSSHGVATNIYPNRWSLMAQYENNLSNARKSLESAEKSYNSCKANTYTCCKKYSNIVNENGVKTCAQYGTCIPNCNSEKDDVNKANEEVTRWQDIVNTANNYKNAYVAAQTILKDMKDCVEWNIPQSTYNFQSSTSMSYNDPEYGTAYTLEVDKERQSCAGCKSDQTLALDPISITSARFQQVINDVESRNITLTDNVSYTLPKNLYHYVNKKTNKPMMSPKGDYITIGYSNLPTSYDAKLNKKYDLNIYVNSLGHAGNFTSNANQKQYSCNYSVHNGPSDECVCPEGTKHAGKDLYCEIYKAGSTTTTLTCADAQVLYCDQEDFYDEVCTDEKYCPNDSSIKLTACMNNGYSYSYCVDTLCYGGGDKDYHCPKGTYNDGMDIKPCVFANIGMGLEKAIKYCQDTVCPYKGGINIIYRPISLRNPFPGKDAIGSAINFSLDNRKSRYPGSNWNSATLVKNEILYNRKTEGNSVYDKEPLYSFVLTADVIKNIRDYNNSQEKSGGYADYTLECKGSNGLACLSNQFLRNNNSGLVGGKCSKASGNNFYTCAED